MAKVDRPIGASTRASVFLRPMRSPYVDLEVKKLNGGSNQAGEQYLARCIHLCLLHLSVGILNACFLFRAAEHKGG